VHLPDTLADAVPVSSLALTNFHIGTGGVTGSIALNGTAPDATLGGFSFRPTSLAIEFKQNALVQAALEGTLTLPFFDQPVNVTVGFDVSGSLTIGLAANQPSGATYSSGLVTLEKAGLLRLTLESLRLSLADGVFTIILSGEILPLVG